MIARRDTICALLLATLGALFVNVEPAIASTLTTGFHLEPHALGMLLSLESAGAILGGVIAYMTLPALGARTFVFLSLLSYAVANAATTFSASYGVLATCRVVAGVAEGALLATAFAIIALTQAPHRVFAAFGIAQTACAIAAFPILAWLFRVGGWQSAFVLFAIAGIACIAARPSSSVRIAREERQSETSGPSVKGLLSIFIFFTAQTALWPFLERIGLSRGIGDFAISGALSFGALCGLLGSIAVTALPARIAGLGTCALAGLLNVIAIATISVTTGATAFVVGLGTFNFAWAAFMPLQLNVLKRSQAPPKTFALASTATSLGFAAGPALAGATIHAEHYTVPLVIGMLGTPLALLVLLPQLFARRSKGVPAWPV